MSLTKHEADEAVARGIALLDRVHPGWVDEIDLSELELSCPDYCILGQVYGTYHRGLNALTQSRVVDERMWFSMAHGFNCASERSPDLDVLQWSWIEAITARRGGLLANPT